MFSEEKIHTEYNRFDRQFAVSTKKHERLFLNQSCETVVSCGFIMVNGRAAPIDFSFNLYYLNRLTEKD